jgi:small conductance mechanosensitive channel
MDRALTSARRINGLLLLFAYAAALALPLCAQQDRATVRFYGRPLFRVGATESQDATTRARQIERRLEALTRTGGPAQRARVETSTSNPAERMITSGGIAIVTLTPGDAEESLTDIDTLARQWAAIVDAAFTRVAQEEVEGWGGLLLRVRGAFRSAFSRLLESTTELVPGVLAGALVIFLFWGLATATRSLLRVLTRRTVRDETAASLIRQVGYYTIWTLGLFVAAGALGFEPQTVITGLGLTSLALGFALKDILSNFVSGLLLLLLRPFQLGDQIVIGDTEGSVVRIELRATQIRTYDGRIVYVPNADIFTSRVTNNTAAPIRQAKVLIPVGYDQSVGDAIRVLQTAVENTQGVLPEPSVWVRLQDLTPQEVQIEMRFWTDSRRSDFAATSAAVRQNAVDALKSAGIALPNPSARSVQMMSGEENAQPVSALSPRAPRVLR